MTSCENRQFWLNKLFYTQSRSKDTGHFLIMCARSFRKCTERGGSNPEWTASLCIFAVPILWNSSVIKMGRVKNSYPGAIAAFKVLFELVYLSGSARFKFIWCDRGIFEYFAKQNNPVFLRGHFTRVELFEAIGLCGFRCYPRVICRVDTTAFATSYLARLYCKIFFKLSRY